MQLEADIAEFNSRNTQVIALAVQDQAGAMTMASRANVSYPILADPDHRVAEAYGVFNLLNDGVAAPSVFVINKSGQIVWHYIGQNINDRPPSGTILQNIPPQ